jgi:cytochrome c oxidase subunit 1
MNVEPSYLDAKSGVAAWLLTRDHKRIGLMFLFATVVFLVLGGAFAMLLRTELVRPERDLFDASTYNRFFTLHGVIMVWLFLIPSIPSGFGNFVLPMMIGAKDVAFPRLNLASFYIYFVGALVILGSLVGGGVDTGWTFYTPYSASSPTAVVPTAIGIFIVGISSIITGINFMTTVHTMRCKGMRWHRMPLFVWAIYATSIIQVLATPVLGLVLLLVGVDHAFGVGIFDPAVGGDPVLYQHLFWFYSHPAVYIMILPTMGVISEVVCTFAHKNPAWYRGIAYSSLGIAFIGFLTWGHHMFVSGMSPTDSAIFGVLSMFVAIFSAIKVFTWTFTLHRGRIVLATPMFYLFAFLFLFVFGGMTGVAVATQSLDVHWHDTYFVVAHFHFIMVGGAVTGFLAAWYYWFPKMFGRMYDERVGLLTAALVFGGFFLTFFPQFLLGNAGMPRRYYSYPEEYQALNVLSTGGSWALGLAIILALGSLVVAWRKGPQAPANPWSSRSFEWSAPSPPPVHNFPGELAVDRGAYDYHLSQEEADESARGR